MPCAHCGFPNPDGIRFCGGCGHPVSSRCGACGFESPAGFRFCGGCGAPLFPGGAAVPRAEADAAPLRLDRGGDPTAERRQLTVMFCDLVGSTSLSAQLDPEELREIVRSYQSVSGEVIGAYDGHVAQYLGDGILAYFGFPVALENEAGRAVRAGRDLLREIRVLSERLERASGVCLALRIGIHTGVVVVGEIGAGQRREHLALGETPNVAARIQAIAEPNTVVISGDTHRLVRDEFECEDLGTRTIRGVSTPVRLFRPVRERVTVLTASPRADAVEPLIGRDDELAVLRESWGRVLRGRGTVVTMGGDPGLGKTTLVRAFANGLSGDESTILDGRCLPYFHSTAYHPIADVLHRWMGCAPDDAPARRRELLSALLERLGFAEAEPVVASLLGSEPARGGSAGSKERTRAVLIELLLRAAEQRPLLLYLEDVHWADPSTVELLGVLADRVADRRALLILTHRPEFEPPWNPPEHQVQLTLGRLRTEQVTQLIDRVAGGRPLPGEVTRQIIDRTDGVPLFVEELTRMVIESGLLRELEDRFELAGGVLPALAIPLTLHDSLEARLERLATGKELAQLGAVLGREFSYELLRAVAGVEEDALRSSLDRLEKAELLVRTGQPPQAVYGFKHALIQEAAYQSLLRGARQGYHLRAAQTLEAQFPERVEAQPELLAQHYTAAGESGRAIGYWIRAGRRAVERSAHREAVLHLNQALELLSRAPASAAAHTLELEALLALGPALIALQGHAAQEVRDTYVRASLLSAEHANASRRFDVLMGLFTSHVVRLETPEAYAVAREVQKLAETGRMPGQQMAAQVALGVALLGRGQVRQALEQLEQARSRYDARRDFRLAHAIGQDFGVVASAYGAFALAATGRVDEADRQAGAAVDLARSLNHPHSLCLALAFAATVGYFRREPARVLEQLRELAPLAEREGHHHWLLVTPPLEAWALTEAGQGEEGLAPLHATDARQSVQGRDSQFLFWRHIAAEALLRAGRARDAASLLERLLSATSHGSAHLWWLSEPMRLYGTALARLGRGAEAEARLWSAVEYAEARRADLFCLRALRDLAAVRHPRRGSPEVLVRLRERCGGLTEGLHLPDLVEARSLLDGAAPELPMPG